MNKAAKLEKMQTINETFDIAQESLKDIEFILDEETNTALPAIYDDSSTNELITLETLKNDLRTIRFTLLNSTQQGQKIVNKITEDILSDSFVDPKLVESVASMIKSINGSFKELSSIFKEIQELEDKKKGKSTTEIKGDVTNTQNIYVGNASDLLNMLGKN